MAALAGLRRERWGLWPRLSPGEGGCTDQDPARPSELRACGCHSCILILGESLNLPGPLFSNEINPCLPDRSRETGKYEGSKDLGPGNNAVTQAQNQEARQIVLGKQDQSCQKWGTSSALDDLMLPGNRARALGSQGTALTRTTLIYPFNKY